jgi:hypothetical protein
VTLSFILDDFLPALQLGQTGEEEENIFNEITVEERRARIDSIIRYTGCDHIETMSLKISGFLYAKDTGSPILIISVADRGCSSRILFIHPGS